MAAKTRRTVTLAAASALLTLGASAAPGDDREASRCADGGDGMVWVPGGKARLGSDTFYPEEGPGYETAVKGFWIDRHEVTNRQYAAFVAATGYETAAERRGDSILFDPPGLDELAVDPRLWWKITEGADWRHPAGPGSDLSGRWDMPVVHVSHADAAAYAKWAGRQLPSEEQFEYAALGGGIEPVTQPSPTQANTWQGEFPGRNEVSDRHAGLAPAGCFDANGYRLHDMVGNAWEWTSSWYLPGHQAVVTDSGGAPSNPSFDPRQPNARVRVIKGGSFLCAPNYCARYRPAARHAQDERYGASHLGFRTVSPVPPSLTALSSLDELQ